MNWNATITPESVVQGIQRVEKWKLIGSLNYLLMGSYKLYRADKWKDRFSYNLLFYLSYQLDQFILLSKLISEKLKRMFYPPPTSPLALNRFAGKLYYLFLNSFEALLQWKEEKGRAATKEELIRVLKLIGYEDLADKLTATKVFAQNFKFWTEHLVWAFSEHFPL